jgi:hypothetical protein
MRSASMSCCAWSRLSPVNGAEREGAGQEGEGCANACQMCASFLTSFSLVSLLQNY